ncbi:MAG: fibronectin type III domain-containing protein [Solirubrobacterales bacterium]
MRSHAKAATAGSTQRQAKGLGGIFRGAIATRGASLTANGSGAPKAGRLLLPVSLLVALIALLAIAVPASASTIVATWSESVAFSEATLRAEVNPDGEATTYHFEYGKTGAYGSQTPELPVGSDSTAHKLSRSLEGLTPGTTYHYRVVATSGAGTNPGPDAVFHTYESFIPKTDCPNQSRRGGPSGALPDCRAYEMVSPLDKSGADIVPAAELAHTTLGIEQAALDGEKMAYSSRTPFGDAASNLWATQFLATRAASGWSAHAVTPPRTGNSVYNGAATQPNYRDGEFAGFNDDLSTGFFYDGAMPALTPQAIPGIYNHYLFNTATDGLTTVSTQLFSPVHDDVRWLGGVGFMGFSEDGSHTVFAAEARLTSDAAAPAFGQNLGQLYDYHDGALELVSILPNGEPAATAAAGFQRSAAGEFSSGGDALSYKQRVGETDNAISDDGSRIFWTTQSNNNEKRLYVRIDGTTTILISESVPNGNRAHYWTASSDGAKVLFSADGSFTSAEDILYRFDVDTETPSQIAGEVDPERGVLGASDDLSHVYFLSTEALTSGATAGQQNLYLDHDGTKSFIATLAESDRAGGVGGYYNVASGTDVAKDFSHVTPDGRHLVFQSFASLTGYDNTSLDNGKAAIEVYRYDAEAKELDCISCNPSGSRPQTGVLTMPHYDMLEGVPFGDVVGNPDPLHAAAWLPTRQHGDQVSRALADDGSHVFFNSHDALVPQDTNGVQDVYEWREQGSGECQKPSGCLYLISTGTDLKKSTFIDASEGGHDVFFRTSDGIDPDDEGLIDIYDARTNGGIPRPIPPPPCVGDNCQSPPAAPNDPTPASSGFKGAGDPVPSKARKSCRARNRKAKKQSGKAKQSKAKQKKAKRCKRNNRRAGR